MPSPLYSHLQDLGATFLPWGPPEAAVPIVESFGELALEYAAIRKSALLLDLPLRATIEVRGADRLDFLERMLTQKIKEISPLSARRSFWLNRKGRIDADLRLIALPDTLLLDVDVHAAAKTIATLTDFVFSEDVTFDDRSASLHRLALHGPSAGAMLASVAEMIEGPSAETLPPGQAALVRIAGVRVTLDRQDDTGAPGFNLLVPVEGAEAVVQALVGDLELAAGPLREGTRPAIRLGGWAAFNVARIEAGTPVFFVDFGPDSLPHETSLLASRVHFAKGCYLGQEVVARMESRGHPKQRLVALRFDRAAATDGQWPEPQTGAGLFTGPEPTGETEPAIGAITSACPSPMLGGEPVALAMVKFAHAGAGSRLWVDVGDRRVEAIVQDGLRTLPA